MQKLLPPGGVCHVVAFKSFCSTLNHLISAPKWYSQYRFYLSILVGSWWAYFILIPYQRAHGLIFSILGSVAGTTYWGPVAGHGFLSHDLDLIRKERKKNMPVVHGMIQGPIEAVPAGTDADHYTKIHNKEKNGN
jgi:hypothetical protein